MKQSQNLGHMTDQLFSLKNEKRELNSRISDLNLKIKVVEAELLEEMQQQKLHNIKGANGTVYISRQVVPKVLNWEEFYEFIREHGYFHMLERRPSRMAFRESYEQGVRVPGVDPVLFDEVRTRKS